jgi:tetratricopeptide (TPR) repeat protein
MEEAEIHYRSGIAAGARALGQAFFDENVGYFWNLVETRPYMRARAGLAGILFETVRLDEAIQHFQELLQLNPPDDQGVRSILAVALFRAGRYRELEQLLESFAEDMTPDICFTRALWLYRTRGDCPEGSAALNRGILANPHVPALLLGRKKPRLSSADTVTVGGIEEASHYAVVALPDWRSTPGALFWLRKKTSKPRRGRSTKR